MDAFSRLAAEQFEVRMYKYLAKTFPDNVKGLPEQAIRESIQAGVERAAAYGISSEYDVARFVDLMYRVSSDFDSHPEIPWVRATLMSSVMTTRAKMDVVYGKLTEDRSAGSPE